jgi:uncharacterized protein
MAPDYHRVPAEAFDALAAGGGDHAAIDLLCRAQYSKHAVLLHGVAANSPGPARDLLARTERKDLDAVTAVIRYPSVGAWALRTLLALRGSPRVPSATPDGLAAIAATAAIRAGMLAEIDVPVHDGMVVLPSMGIASLPASSAFARARITPGLTEITAAGARVVIPPDHRSPGPGWQPVRPVTAGSDGQTGAWEIVVDDADPFRMPAAPHLGTAPDLARWRTTFADAWTLLRCHHTAVAAEVAAMVTVIVPLLNPAEGLASSSSPETFGAIAMSEPADPVNLAGMLTHEVQHMKLSAMLDMVTLTRPDDDARYYAPWRDDPRPASGLLQGAYAYLGVTGFWRRQRGLAPVPGTFGGADVEFARWREATALVTGTLLASGRLTDDGRRFVATMSATLRGWLAEPVPDDARRLAVLESERHMTRWRSQHGPIQRFDSCSAERPSRAIR